MKHTQGWPWPLCTPCHWERLGKGAGERTFCQEQKLDSGVRPLVAPLLSGGKHDTLPVGLSPETWHPDDAWKVLGRWGTVGLTVGTGHHLAPGAGAAAACWGQSCLGAAADSMEQASPEPSLPAPQSARPEPPPTPCLTAWALGWDLRGAGIGREHGSCPSPSASCHRHPQHHVETPGPEVSTLSMLTQLASHGSRIKARGMLPMKAALLYLFPYYIFKNHEIFFKRD